MNPTIRNCFLLNSRWQNRKERPNRSKVGGDMVDKAERYVSEGVSLWHISDYREAEPLMYYESFVSKGKIVMKGGSFVYFYIKKGFSISRDCMFLTGSLQDVRLFLKQ